MYVGFFGLVFGGDKIVVGVNVDGDLFGKGFGGFVYKVGVFDCDGIQDDVSEVLG